MSNWFSVDGEREACCVYETQSDCDADDEGAYAPRIVETA